MSTVADVSYRWFEAPVREGLQVTQVYGYLICPSTGRVLIQDDDDEGVFNLPGGTPEAWDSGLSATLLREAMEESQIRIDDAVDLGFQEVRRPGRAPYAQVRMAGRISGFERRGPDPDGGRMYRRLLCPLAGAADVLGWGEPAVAQAPAAGRVAAGQWDIDIDVMASITYVD